MAESPRGDAFELASVVKGASQLERRVLVLAARAEYLGSFLASVSAPELRNELERVRARERGALAADARRTYSRVVRRTEGHIQSLAALEAEKDRVAAKLDYMVGTLEALPAKVTRVQFLRLGYVDADLSAEAVEDATRVFDDVGALEDAFAIRRRCARRSRPRLEHEGEADLDGRVDGRREAPARDQPAHATGDVVGAQRVFVDGDRDDGSRRGD